MGAAEITAIIGAFNLIFVIYDKLKGSGKKKLFQSVSRIIDITAILISKSETFISEVLIFINEYQREMSEDDLERRFPEMCKKLTHDDFSSLYDNIPAILYDLDDLGRCLIEAKEFSDDFPHFGNEITLTITGKERALKSWRNILRRWNRDEITKDEICIIAGESRKALQQLKRSHSLLVDFYNRNIAI